MNTELRIPDPDGFYAALLAAHEGRTDAQSADLNARLVLLLANQCADQGVLLACIQAAAAAEDPTTTQAP
ncbi:DUF2783 domain-containing protein [Hydrogenophaga sp.]|uniref:DUF2783 domain-containing protein n=1 Tax=Hydrogenophaga sp. TaxID=1904254 RepID=UPI00271D8268|nr:DUF2783 domain-containing protein [Hydrogenophaga sp.]MDO9439117.1 DUF2783 domain-containing protein [Hydrogenophaga sp.]